MIIIKATNTWNKYLDLISDNKKDVYFYEEYVKLYQNKNAEAICVIAEEDNNIALFPILRTQIENVFDFETPYGYGGVISNTYDQKWNNRAIQLILNYFIENKYIAGFVRFHPLLHNELLCSSRMEIFSVIFNRYTVSIDLTQTEDDIFSVQMSLKNRRQIRKAIAEDLQFCVDNEFVYLDDFIDIYNNTMMRVEADNFYFFDNHYYKSFVNDLKGKAFLGCVKKDDCIIAAALFMYSKTYGHYHLGGSIKNTYHGVNDLLLWKAAIELKNRGIKEFHLGGGTDSDIENSLFKFKKSFSNSVKDFYIGKIIFNQKAYHQICEKWEKNNPDKKVIYQNRLLKYRY